MINYRGDNLLGRSDLEIIKRTTLNYPLAIAEKDYFLALVLQIIYSSPLKDKLIFKGGTALYHTYLPQLRFSEDLDFSANKVLIDIEMVRKIFVDFDFLEIKKDYLSEATIKIEKLQYSGPLGQPNSLKVDIDFLQNVVLEPREMDYQNVYGVEVKARVMDIREITAEKIRAMNDRARYRDFYDFTMIDKKLGFNLKEILNLVKQKEVRKNINPKNISDNWQVALQSKQAGLDSIYYSEILSDKEIEKSIHQLQFTEISESLSKILP